MELKFKKFQVVEKVLVIEHTYDELKDSCDYDRSVEHERTLFVCADEKEALERLKAHIIENEQILNEDVASWDCTEPFLISGACTYELRKARLMDIETVDAEVDKFEQLRMNREYDGKSFFVFSPTTIKGIVRFNDWSEKFVSKEDVLVECGTGTRFTVKDMYPVRDAVALVLNVSIYVPSTKKYVREIYISRDGRQIRELYEQHNIQITR